MDKALKQRLVGATVLVALAVVVLPMLLGGRPESAQDAEPIEIPPRPAELEFEGPRRFPIGEQAPDQPAEIPADRVTPALGPATGDGEVTDEAADAPAETMEERLERIATESEATVPAAAGARAGTSTRPAPADAGATADQATAAAAPDPAVSDATAASAQGQEPTGEAPAPVEPVPGTPPANGRYVVQVASFSSTANADRLSGTLRSGGMPVMMDTVDSAAGTLHRVRVGPFAQRAEAEQVMARLGRQVPDVRPRLVDLRPDEESQVTEPDDPLVRWEVQVGVFSEAANAEKLVFQLRDAGFRARSRAETAGDRTVYRVRVGPEISRADAIRVRDRIEAEQGIRGMVQSTD